MALVKPRTTNDIDIFIVDRRANGPKLITAHTGDVSNFPVDFTPDSTRLLFVSNGGREFASLRSHELTTGAQCGGLRGTLGRFECPGTRRAAAIS